MAAAATTHTIKEREKSVSIRSRNRKGFPEPRSEGSYENRMSWPLIHPTVTDRTRVVSTLGRDYTSLDYCFSNNEVRTSGWIPAVPSIS